MTWHDLFQPIPCIKRVLGSWFMACILFTCLENWIPVSSWLFFLLTMGFFFALGLLKYATSYELLEDIVLCISAAVYGLLLVYRYDGKAPYAFLLIVLFAIILVVAPILKKAPLPSVGETDLTQRTTRLLVCLFGIVLTVGIASFSVTRYLSFATPNFDFGLFCNMFHNMKERFLPFTTSERDGLLSHFAVHISPIFYLLLPLYALFPSPVTLQVGQALVLASGIIPLYLLARKFRISNIWIVLIALVYTVHPAVSAGCAYDLHENCFLLPLLLWLFYLYETDHKRWMTVIAVLILFVKEDAAVFIFIFGLYLLFSRKDYRTGFSLILGAILYFFVAVTLLQRFGTGAMFGRYDALLNPQQNNGSFLETLLRTPGFFLERLVSVTENIQEKPLYLLQMLLPFGLVLWRPGRYSRFLLLLPFAVNLLSGSQYQYDIGFQYGFASLAFCFYLFLQNFTEQTAVQQRNQLLFGAVAACLLYTMIIVPKIELYIGRYASEIDRYMQMEETLDKIPDDASVIASTMLLPHLAQRDTIYEDFYHKEPDTDYVALDMRDSQADFSSSYCDMCLEKGYRIFVSTDDILILQRYSE